MIKVELLNKMGDDLMVANVARVSFGKWKEEFDERDEKLINFLASHEHTSPFRHPQLQLRCEVPLFIGRQLQKHAVGLTWNEISRRYVDEPPEFYYPTSWRNRPDGSVKQGSGSGTVEEMRIVTNVESWTTNVDNWYVNHVEYCTQVYEAMIKAGVAPEQARMILPQSMMISYIWTGSLQAFFNVWRLRIDSHAQLEAQEFAKKLGEICMEHFPHSWRALTNVNN